MKRTSTQVIGLAAMLTMLLGVVETAPAQCAGPIGRLGPVGPGGQHDPYRSSRSYYSPHRYLARPRVHESPNETGLRYFRFMHPYQDYDYYKRTYPHSIDGTFGRPPRQPRDLTLRFRVHPGLSPYSRFHHESALFGEAEGYEPTPETDDYESGAIRRPRDVRAPAPRTTPPAAVGRRGLDVRQSIPWRPRRSSGPTPAEQRAWATLGDEGEAWEAEDAFASLALSHPSHGRPKAGYALARAFQGDDDQAVWNMRRAVRFDGRSLRDVPLDAQLEQTLRSLVERYASEDAHELTPVDAAFMSAAVRFILGDSAGSKEAALAAFEQGDRDASVLTLLLLLRDERPATSKFEHTASLTRDASGG